MALAGLLGYALLWSGLHSLLASASVKRGFERLAGPFWFRFYRLFYNAFSVASLVPLLAIYARLPDRPLYRVGLPWSALMIAGELLAFAALLAAFRSTDIWEFAGLRQLAAPGEAERPALVRSGLYRYVRHPLYTAGLAILWLFPYMTVNLLALDLLFSAYVLAGAWLEEKRLVREFGRDYLAYRAVTPMFLPLPKGRRGSGGTPG